MVGRIKMAAANNGYKALLLINYFLRIKVTLHSQALAGIRDGFF